jgi:hypothetical protein
VGGRQADKLLGYLYSVQFTPTDRPFRQVCPMDLLKPLSEIFTPDFRQARVRLRSADLSMRPVTLEDHHADLQEITLDAEVPEHLRQHMETAKNLMLYSWYVYRFIPVAELHAYSAFEMALRLSLKADDDKVTFRPLLKKAIDNGLIKTQDFALFAEPDPFPIVSGNALIDANLPPDIHSHPDFMQIFLNAIVALRNLLAHGSPSIWPSGVMTLHVMATAINALFRNGDVRQSVAASTLVDG